MSDRLELTGLEQVHCMPSSLDLNVDTSAPPDAYPEGRGISGTLSFGFGVLRMRTAHCIKVVGILSFGTMDCSSTDRSAFASAVTVSRERSGGGGGSANSSHRQHIERGNAQMRMYLPSETGRSSTSRQFVPFSGVWTQTVSTPASSGRMSTL